MGRSGLITDTEVGFMSASWSAEEKQNLPQRYGCRILLERATMDQLHDKSWPNNAYIVTYRLDGQVYKDLCQGLRTKVFDLYYDKFGKGVIENIDWGYGTVSPKLWGYQSKNNDDKKKR